MNVLGIIAEYNPFHNGHLYQLEKCRERSGADFSIAVMSGDFTQRGEAAVIDKYTRTRMALNSGIDLVIELPVQSACMSAGYFALGGISLLNHLGVVTHLGFGSESGEIDDLKKAAALLSDEPEAFKSAFQTYLKRGDSYALARQKALTDCLYGMDSFLTPNNILSVEYLSALKKTASAIIPVTIKRFAAGYHDLDASHAICSAAALRRLTFEKARKGCSGFSEAAKHMPDKAAAIYTEHLKHIQPIDNAAFSDILHYALMTKKALSDYHDIDDELAYRISGKISEFRDFDSFAMLLKSRNYTLSRIRRALIHLLVELKDTSFHAMAAADFAPYARVLGFRREALSLLTAIKKNSDIPLITKTAHAPKLLDAARLNLFNSNILASDVYRIVQNKYADSILPNEYNHGLIII